MTTNEKIEKVAQLLGQEFYSEPFLKWFKEVLKFQKKHECTTPPRRYHQYCTEYYPQWNSHYGGVIGLRQEAVTALLNSREVPEFQNDQMVVASCSLIPNTNMVKIAYFTIGREVTARVDVDEYRYRALWYGAQFKCSTRALATILACLEHDEKVIQAFLQLANKKLDENTAETFLQLAY